MSMETIALTSQVIAPFLPVEMMRTRGKITNLNDAVLTGTYQVAGDSDVTLTGFPKGAYRYGNLVVFGGEFFVVQKYYPHQIKTDGFAVYERVIYRNQGVSSLSSWRGIVGVSIT